jgi:membrane-bound lytic murein transglycosylase D
MKRLIAIGLLVPFISWGQAPKVPSRMEFAGIKLRITEGARREIQADVDALTANATYFNIKVERAASYMPIVERVFAEEGLPDDFKYLAIQESGFIADAVSTSNAVGFWQFKKLTAQEVGLRVDRKVDERQNIVSASRGAAKYLQKNNFYFNNWLHALQAYQMGAGGAMEVLGDKGSGARHMTIDKKTYWYIKTFLAHKVAFEEAIPIAAQNIDPYIEYIAGSGKSLKDIATITNVDYQELAACNTWLLTKNIPDDKMYTVLLPAGSRVKQSSEVVASTGQVTQPARTTEPYSATPFDPSAEPVRMLTLNGLPGAISRVDMSIDEFSEELGMEPVKLIEYNDLLPHGRIVPGQVYYKRPKRNKARIYYHTVEQGETAWSISQRYGLKQEKLLKMNRLAEKDPVLAAGRILWMKKTRPANVPVKYRPVENTGE